MELLEFRTKKPVHVIVTYEIAGGKNEAFIEAVGPLIIETNKQDCMIHRSCIA